MRTIIYKRDGVVYSGIVESENEHHYHIQLMYKLEGEQWVDNRPGTLFAVDKEHENLFATDSIFDVVPYNMDVDLAIDFLIFDSMEVMEPCQR